MLVKWWSLGYFFWDIWTFQYGCQMSRGKTSQNGTWSTKQGLTTPTSHNDGMLSSMWYTQQQTILLKYTRNGWYKPFPTGSDSIFFVCISSCWTNNLAFKTKPLSGKNAHPSSHLKTQIIAFWQTRQHFSGFNKISLSTNIPFFVDTQFLSVLIGGKKIKTCFSHWSLVMFHFFHFKFVDWVNHVNPQFF